MSRSNRSPRHHLTPPRRALSKINYANIHRLDASRRTPKHLNHHNKGNRRSIPRSPGESSSLTFSSHASNALEWKLQRLIDHLSILGVQVSLIHGDRVLADVAGGKCGAFNGMPVDNSTLFSTGGMSSVVLISLLFQMLVKRFPRRQLRDILYESYIADFWPEFGQNGKEKSTLKDLLSHSGGLHRCWPRKCTLKHVLNIDNAIDESLCTMASTSLNTGPLRLDTSGPTCSRGARPSHFVHGRYAHWSSQAALARIIERTACDASREPPQSLADLIWTHLAQPLDLVNELWYPGSTHEDVSDTTSRTIPNLSRYHGPGARTQRVTAHRIRRREEKRAKQGRNIQEQEGDPSEDADRRAVSPSRFESHIKNQKEARDSPDHDTLARAARCPLMWASSTNLCRWLNSGPKNESTMKSNALNKTTNENVKAASTNAHIIGDFKSLILSDDHDRKPSVDGMPDRGEETKSGLQAPLRLVTSKTGFSKALPLNCAQSIRGLAISEEIVYSLTKNGKISRIRGSKKAGKLYMNDRDALWSRYEQVVSKNPTVLRRLKPPAEISDSYHYAIADVLLDHIHLFDAELGDVRWVSEIPIPSLNLRASARALTRICHSMFLHDRFDSLGVLNASPWQSSQVQTSAYPSVAPRVMAHRPLESTDFFEMLIRDPLTVDDDFISNILLGGNRGLFTATGLQAFPQFCIQGEEEYRDEDPTFAHNERISNRTKWGLGSSSTSGSVAYSFYCNDKLTSLAINVSDNIKGPHAVSKIQDLLTRELGIIQDDKWSSAMSTTYEFFQKAVSQVTSNRFVVNDHAMQRRQRELADEMAHPIAEVLARQKASMDRGRVVGTVLDRVIDRFQRAKVDRDARNQDIIEPDGHSNHNN